MRTSVCVWWPLLFSAVAGRQVPIFLACFLFSTIFSRNSSFSQFFRVFLSAGEHFELFEIKLSIKLVNC